jgi:LmbE family N-acetylglucosaminyl deacetylase
VSAALFLFAHQDDEMAANSRIVFELERGASVFCVFLTDGSANVAHEIRDRESSAVLTNLGVALNQIMFIGSEIPIGDGTLVHHLDLALERLERAMAGTELDTIYCLAWEGGNQDHDASHLIAAALAQRRNMFDRCWELPLYRRAGVSGPFFRVLSPLPPRQQWQRRRLTFRAGLRLSLLAWRYRSQWWTWVGLFPEAFLKLAIMRREVLRQVDPSRFRQRPHRGTLLYERRFRFPHERFASAAAGFIDLHFPQAADGATITATMS